MSFREDEIDEVLRKLALPVQKSRGDGIVEKLMNEARREVEGQGAQVVLTAADRKAAREAERLEAAKKREAAREEAAKKREAARLERKAETRALTDVLFKPVYNFQKDMENVGEPSDDFDAEQYLEDMMEEEQDRLAAMTEEERRAYEEEKKMKEMEREIEKEQIEILKESRKADLDRKVQDALQGKPSGLKRSGIERSRQQFATLANKDPFSQRMEGDEFKFGGKKRTIRKKNRKGIKGTRTRATRTRQRKNRTRTMRKKARKSRNSRK
jgi:hypothetical protein